MGQAAQAGLRRQSGAGFLACPAAWKGYPTLLVTLWFEPVVV
jgi:hypothetical protein